MGNYTGNKERKFTTSKNVKTEGKHENILGKNEKKKHN